MVSNCMIRGGLIIIMLLFVHRFLNFVLETMSYSWKGGDQILWKSSKWKLKQGKKKPENRCEECCPSPSREIFEGYLLGLIIPHCQTVKWLLLTNPLNNITYGYIFILVVAGQQLDFSVICRYSDWASSFSTRETIARGSPEWKGRVGKEEFGTSGPSTDAGSATGGWSMKGIQLNVCPAVRPFTRCSQTYLLNY